MVIEIDKYVDNKEREGNHTDTSIAILLAHEYEQNGPSELAA